MRNQMEENMSLSRFVRSWDGDDPLSPIHTSMETHIGVQFQCFFFLCHVIMLLMIFFEWQYYVFIIWISGYMLNIDVCCTIMRCICYFKQGREPMALCRGEDGNKVFQLYLVRTGKNWFAGTGMEMQSPRRIMCCYLFVHVCMFHE